MPAKSQGIQEEEVAPQRHGVHRGLKERFEALAMEGRVFVATETHGLNTEQDYRELRL
jgi:hypothetical protein